MPVADPASDAEILSASAAAAAEPYPLHATVDQQLPTLEEGMQTCLCATYKASFQGFGAAARASRHREQIVVELAQCR